MGLFDEIGGVVGNLLGGNSANLLQVAEQALNGQGGLNGLLGQLQQSGLGDQVASWLGNGQNLPVSADQIRSALSSQQLAGLASSLGINMDQVASVLAQHLPGAVDAASPNGVLAKASA